MKKIALYVSATLLVLLLIGYAVYHKEIRQLYHVIYLFDEDRIVKNFTNMDAIIPIVEIRRAGEVRPLHPNPQQLPETFLFNSTERILSDWIEETATTGLVVIKGESLLYEDYFLGTDEFDRRISWSVAKSFLSALFGIVVEEGYIPDLNVPASDYVPMLIGTGYEGITIKNLLNMSSGVRFNEDYMDFNSDINRFGRAIAFGQSFDEFAASLQNDPNVEQGTYLHYVSIDTHVLGIVIRAATGRSIQELFEEKIWAYAGFEYDAYFIADGLGEPMVLGGLNLRTRDYARFGMLMRDGGYFNGRQIVPENWVNESITPDAPHLEPGERDSASTWFGYGYQWWIPPQSTETTREFMAFGIYGQYIYINMDKNIVIAKNSADTRFALRSENSDLLALAAFRVIADYVTEKEE